MVFKYTNEKTIFKDFFENVEKSQFFYLSIGQTCRFGNGLHVHA